MSWPTQAEGDALRASREEPEHGQHDPSRGWYDSARHAWLDRPDRLTPISHQPDTKRPLDGVTFRASPISTAEAVATAAQSWRPNPQIEQLRKMRGSDRPEIRDQYERIVAGPRRIALGTYEQELSRYLEGGGELPDGVSKPGN